VSDQKSLIFFGTRGEKNDEWQWIPIGLLLESYKVQYAHPTISVIIGQALRPNLWADVATMCSPCVYHSYCENEAVTAGHHSNLLLAGMTRRGRRDASNRAGGAVGGHRPDRAVGNLVGEVFFVQLCHHLIKTVYAGSAAGSNQQMNDGKRGLENKRKRRVIIKKRKRQQTWSRESVA